MENKILILGRPNVGKSSLFNRLVGNNIAIVDKKPNVTIDCIEENVVLDGCLFKIIDSAGFTLEKGEIIDKSKIIIDTILNEINLVLFVVDGRVGIHPLDKIIYKRLKIKNIPFILVVNKIDDEKEKFNVVEFYELGIKEFISISAAHGKNIDELIGYILKYFHNNKLLPEEISNIIKVAIAGRPNVGKSSFINKVTGEEKIVVTDTPGTTRDIVKLPYEYNGQKYLLIDTAGLKKKGKVIKDSVERASIYKTFDGIESSDIVIYMIEGNEGLTSRDERIVSNIIKLGKAVIFVVNKWDLVKEKKEKKAQLYRNISERYHLLGKPYISYISAKEGTDIYAPLKDVKRVFKIYNIEVKTSLLNEIIKEAQLHYQPPVINGKRIKIYYATQISSRPPKFLFFINYPESLQENYRKYIINTLRRALNLRSIPIELTFKGRKRVERSLGSR